MNLTDKIIKALHEYAVLCTEYLTEDDPQISLQEEYFEETVDEIKEIIALERYKFMSEYAKIIGYAIGALEGASYHISDKEIKEIISNHIKEIDSDYKKAFDRYVI